MALKKQLNQDDQSDVMENDDDRSQNEVADDMGPSDVQVEESDDEENDEIEENEEEEGVF